MRRAHWWLCAWLWALPCQVLWARPLDTRQQQAVADGALQAQTACYKNIYRDTNAYTQCVRDLAQTESPGSYKRLGMEYFGFVGAMAYARLSQLGAEQAAMEFLKKYRRTQKQLAVDDASLCSSVPGNCTVRMAQAREMESAPPPAPVMRVQCQGQVCRIAPVE